MAVIVAAAGTLLAIFTPIEQYENFLFLIGSVFAPMISILIVDFFIVSKDHCRESINITNFVLWGAGFMLYRLFMTFDTVIGNTLPVMVIICVFGAAIEFARVRLTRADAR